MESKVQISIISAGLMVSALVIVVIAVPDFRELVITPGQIQIQRSGDNDDTSSAEDGEGDSEEESSSHVWKEGSLTIPVLARDTGMAADLDDGHLLPIGTSISAPDADIAISQSPHAWIIQPGLSKGDGITFDAHFYSVGDSPAGYDNCRNMVLSQNPNDILALGSSLNVGSYVCMSTNQKRLAEFEVVSVDSEQRKMDIKYTVWQKVQ